MSSTQYTRARALLLTAAAFRSTAPKLVRRSHTCVHSRSLSLAAAARQQLVHMETPRPGSGVVAASTGHDALNLEFCDGRQSALPYAWLRDNCQCHKCSSSRARQPGSHFQVTADPEIIQSNVFGVVVDWNDGHISKYPGEWLHRVAHDLTCNS